MIGCGRSRPSNTTEVIVILSILLAQSFRVSSAVIAVRVRLCKSMELRHGSTRASLACKSTSHRVAEQPSLVHSPTRQRKKAWPAHPHPDHWFVSSRLISTSHRFLLSLHTLHARTAPHSTPLPLSSVCTFATRQAPPSRQTRQYTSISPCNNCPASIAIYCSSARLQQ